METTKSVTYFPLDTAYSFTGTGTLTAEVGVMFYCTVDHKRLKMEEGSW
jgi:hypothetical protein